LENLYTFVRLPFVLDAWTEYKDDADGQKGKRGVEKAELGKLAVQALETDDDKYMGIRRPSEWTQTDNKIRFIARMVTGCRSRTGIWSTRGDDELKEMVDVIIEVLQVMAHQYSDSEKKTSTLVAKMRDAAERRKYDGGRTIDNTTIVKEPDDASNVPATQSSPSSATTTNTETACPSKVMAQVLRGWNQYSIASSPVETSIGGTYCMMIRQNRRTIPILVSIWMVAMTRRTRKALDSLWSTQALLKKGFCRKKK
jgi:hypothetical protein